MTINATMINVQADGTVAESGETRSIDSGQRVAFDSRFDNSGKGVSRDLNDLFPDGPLASAEASFTDTRTEFLLNEVPVHENPDFPGGVDLLYSKTKNMLVHVADEDTLPGDKPSSKGPNLAVPKINDDGSVEITEMSNVTREETSRGFGVTVEHNTEGVLIEGRYLNRKADEVGGRIKLGEYLDVDEYNW